MYPQIGPLAASAHGPIRTLATPEAVSQTPMTDDVSAEAPKATVQNATTSAINFMSSPSPPTLSTGPPGHRRQAGGRSRGSRPAHDDPAPSRHALRRRP